MKPDDRDCANCKHFKERTESGDQERYGTCHRYPPQMVPSPEGEPYSLFPICEPTDHCGEFAAPH